MFVELIHNFLGFWRILTALAEHTHVLLGLLHEPNSTCKTCICLLTPLQEANTLDELVQNNLELVRIPNAFPNM